MMEHAKDWMKITKQMDSLIEKIIEAQIGYHITGEFDSNMNELVVEHETKGGKTIIHKAERNWNCSRGLSYKIVREEISIAKGHREWLIGFTEAWYRESVRIG